MMYGRAPLKGSDVLTSSMIICIYILGIAVVEWLAPGLEAPKIVALDMLLIAQCLAVHRDWLAKVIISIEVLITTINNRVATAI